jgi:hypothetical protein
MNIFGREEDGRGRREEKKESCTLMVALLFSSPSP